MLDHPSSTGLHSAFHRHGDVEDRTLTLLAFNPNFAPMQLDEFARDGQPQTRALSLAGDRAVHLMKGLEDALLFCDRNADTRIAHPK